MIKALRIIATVTVLALPSSLNAADRAVFSCKAGPRLVQVVRSGSTLSYRSTRNGRLELQISGGVLARTGFSGGGEIQTTFRNRGWRYVVYDRIVRTGFSGNNAPEEQAGVDVFEGARLVTHVRCDDGGTQFSTTGLEGLVEGEFIDH